MFDQLFIRFRAVVFGLLVLSILPVLVGPPTPAAAQTGGKIIRVTVNGMTSGACGNLTDWSNACALQYALTSVAVSGDEVWVAAGAYTPTSTSSPTDRRATFQLRNGIALYGGFGGWESVLGQRTPAANVTRLSGDIGAAGNADNSYHVVTGSGTDPTAVLDGFTVEAGNANGASSPDNQGGGMYSDSGNPTLKNITFTGNAADNSGGGLFILNSSLTLTNVTFSNNLSEYGGGMYARISNPTLINVTFSNNRSYYVSGMYSLNGNPKLFSATFSGNQNIALVVGGGTVEVSNSIFWGNGTQISYYPVYPGDIFILSDSIVQDGCPSGVWCGTVFTADPRLGDLGNYGGSTPTVPLLPGSSAINAGYNPKCPATDQRGVARSQGGRCDIGAYESRPFTLAKTGGDNQRTASNTAFATPLGVGVSSASGDPVDGGLVTFSAPSSGASAVPQTSTVAIASGGVATSPTLFANNIAGSYQVTAITAGAGAPVSFSLTNARSTTTALSSSANPAVSGQNVTFTAAVSGASPGGAVTFKDGGTDIPGCASVSMSGGSATCTVASLALGAHALTAAYSGDANNSTSSGALTQVVNKADTTTTLTASSNPSTFGQSVTFNAAVSVVSPGSGAPSGTVQFKADGVNLGSVVNLSNGSASVTTAALSGGAHVVTAEYSGNANLNASSGALSPDQTVTPANTTTTLDSSANPSTYGQAVTFVATVASGAGTPGGSVQFKVDGADLGSAVSLSGGQASLSTASLSGGTHTITAQYSGSANHAASSGTLSPNQRVNPANSSVSLTASANPSVLGQSVSFTATVAGYAPTGTISFSDNGEPIAGCQNVTLVNRTATCTTTPATAGAHTIGAAYSGDANNSAAGGTLAQVVGQVGTTMTLTSSANPSVFGQTVTFTATVSGTSPGGAVTFKDGGTAITGCVAVALSGARAVCTIASPTLGPHPISADYSGDAANQPGSGALAQVVNKANTTTSIVASVNPSVADNVVTFTVTVRAVAPGSGTPTGPVDFYETLAPGAASVGALASPTLVNGVATFTVSSLSAGVHSLLAVYSGDANFNANTSAIYSQTVNSRIYHHYLPLIFNDLASSPNLAPDLVVDSVTTGPSVTLRNAGNAAVTNDFWVDVYFNPNPAPPPLNRTWQSIAPYGAHWGVTSILAPGETLSLTVGGPYYAGGSSTFPAGAQVYAYVDSINYATTYGNVQESNEGNNVFGPVVSTAAGSLPAGAAPQAAPAGLPER